MTDTAASSELDPATQRALAVALFNRVWELLEKADRTAEDDHELVNAAHASDSVENAKREFAIVKPGENNFKQVVEEVYGKL